MNWTRITTIHFTVQSHRITNETFNLTNVQRLMSNGIYTVTDEYWKFFKHAERLREEDFENEYIRGSVIKPITIS
jgi:hypothetical protein